MSARSTERPSVEPLDSFYREAGRPLPVVRIVPEDELPQPQRRLLAHNSDMTRTLEAFHGGSIHLLVKSRERRGDELWREVVLTLDRLEQPVEFGAIRIWVDRFPAASRDDILACRPTPAFRELIERFGQVFAGVSAPAQWFIEAHQFRIDASQGEGRPTPEGAHRDGVDFVALVLMERGDVAGGATTIHSDDGATLADVTLAVPWTAMLLDDQRVIHATTPIKPVGLRPHRDTLVLTYRRDGFLEPA